MIRRSKISSGARFEPDEIEALDNVIRLATYVGTNRTMQEDIDFGFRQITDVALKALSPGINDPTTAIEAILRLATVLRHMLEVGLPDQIHFAKESGVLVLHPWDLDAGEYVRHAFGQIRGVAAGQPAVVICLLRTMTMLRGVAADELDRLKQGGRHAGSAGIAGVSREWHLTEALKQLRTQQRLTLEHFEAIEQLPEDLAYVRLGLPVTQAAEAKWDVEHGSE